MIEDQISSSISSIPASSPLRHTISPAGTVRPSMNSETKRSWAGQFAPSRDLFASNVGFFLPARMHAHGRRSFASLARSPALVAATAVGRC
jgi:hypothetical protein